MQPPPGPSHLGHGRRERRHVHYCMPGICSRRSPGTDQGFAALLDHLQQQHAPSTLPVAYMRHTSVRSAGAAKTSATAATILGVPCSNQHQNNDNRRETWVMMTCHPSAGIRHSTHPCSRPDRADPPVYGPAFRTALPSLQTCRRWPLPLAMVSEMGIIFGRYQD